MCICILQSVGWTVNGQFGYSQSSCFEYAKSHGLFSRVRVRDNPQHHLYTFTHHKNDIL